MAGVTDSALQVYSRRQVTATMRELDVVYSVPTSRQMAHI